MPQCTNIDTYQQSNYLLLAEEVLFNISQRNFERGGFVEISLGDNQPKRRCASTASPAPILPNKSPSIRRA